MYPVKSFDAVELNEVIIGKRCLMHDREFAVFNQEGKYVNGKRTPRINELRSSFDMNDYTVIFRVQGEFCIGEV
ncbi:MAG: MOSC N-terminal beta barrel domain-containing protein [Ignavibacteria bacterium]|nr:MOSC N-terminal beta barrel domain-containing protein [Ignavibacteria bacterium]